MPNLALNEEPEIQINPEVLRWARESAGFLTPGAVEHKLRLEDGALTKFERRELIPSIALIRRLAKLYKRPFLVMFIPAPPKDEKLPPDYRGLPKSERELSIETYQALGEARRLQEALSSLTDEDPKLSPQFNFKDFQQKNIDTTLGERIRVELKLTYGEQKAWVDYDYAFRAWRGKLQQHGIIVLVEDMPRDEVAGFSLWHPELIPTIVVNGRQAKARQIFTLFHELGHIFLKAEAMCLDEEGHTPLGKIEAQCNRFAASILLPKTEFEIEISSVLATSKNPRIPEVEDLRPLAQSLKVSRHAIALRMQQLGLVVPDYYDQIKDKLDQSDYPQEYRKVDSGKGKGRPRNMPVERLAEIGFAAANLVINARKREFLSTLEAADILRLRPKNLRKLTELAEFQRQRYGS